jgi:hypothetical protein
VHLVQSKETTEFFRGVGAAGIAVAVAGVGLFTVIGFLRQEEWGAIIGLLLIFAVSPLTAAHFLGKFFQVRRFTACSGLIAAFGAYYFTLFYSLR